MSSDTSEYIIKPSGVTYNYIRVYTEQCSVLFMCIDYLIVCTAVILDNKVAYSKFL